MPGAISIFNQWSKRPVREKQEFTLPTCTVPDQSLTVPEIIARFTRAGVVPQGITALEAGRIILARHGVWPGDQSAMSPDFDPMDSGGEYLDAVHQQHQGAADGSSAEESTAPAAGEPQDGATGAEGGETI